MSTRPLGMFSAYVNERLCALVENYGNYGGQAQVQRHTSIQALAVASAMST